MRYVFAVLSTSLLLGSAGIAYAVPQDAFEPHPSGCPLHLTGDATVTGLPTAGAGPVGNDNQKVEALTVELDGDHMIVGIQLENMATRLMPGFRATQWTFAFRTVRDGQYRGVNFAYDLVDGYVADAGYSLSAPETPIEIVSVTPGPHGGIVGRVPLAAVQLQEGDMLNRMEVTGGQVTPYEAKWYGNRPALRVWTSGFAVAPFPLIACPSVVITNTVNIGATGIGVSGHFLPPKPGTQTILIERSTEGGWETVTSFKPSGAAFNRSIDLGPGEHTIRAVVADPALGRIESEPRTVVR